MIGFADGSVIGIDNTIDFELFHSLGTINGREPFSRDEIR